MAPTKVTPTWKPGTYNVANDFMKEYSVFSKANPRSEDKFSGDARGGNLNA